MTPPARQQRTIAGPAEVWGIGLHTGAHARARMLPAPPDHGIAFRRADLPGAPEVPARLAEVVDTGRGVVLGRAVRVSSVEHLLSAARGLGIDNLLVELAGEELPSGDGSATIFTDALAAAGAVGQDAVIHPITLAAPVLVAEGSSLMVALPAPAFAVTCLTTVDGTNLPAQVAHFPLDAQDYTGSIASARTWGLLSDITALWSRGLARGASLATVLVLQPDGPFTEFRFPNELARHKTLDVIGDLALLGRPLCAHVVAVRTGHTLHVALGREIARQTAAAADG